MNTTARLGLLAALLLSAAAASAQPGPGPGMGPGMGAGPGAARGGMMGPRYGAGITPGWGLMSAEERTAHQNAMRNMKTYEECHAYAEQHHQQMAERAKEKGQTLPDAPRRDVCAGLKK